MKLRQGKRNKRALINEKGEHIATATSDENAEIIRHIVNGREIVEWICYAIGIITGMIFLGLIQMILK